MNTSGLLKSKCSPQASLTLQGTQSIHDSINICKNRIHFLNEFEEKMMREDNSIHKHCHLILCVLVHLEVRSVLNDYI